MRNVHCQDNKRRFRLSGLSPVGHDQIQTIATLADSVAALYHIAITAVLIGLSVVFVRSILLGPAKFRTGQADAVFLAEGSVFTVSVDGVCQNRFRIVAKAILIPFSRCLQPNPLVVVVI